MSQLTPESPRTLALYDLLPEIYRVRDEEQQHVLLQLLDVLALQLDVLDEDLSQLYDDQFIETCAPWAAPYIGDLIGYRMLNGIADKVRSPRAEIANTIAYRRRKGTASMLEQLARDVTGYPARAVEFFQLLATSQYMNHVRPDARATASVRSTDDLAWVVEQNAAFDPFTHTADVRRISGAPPYRSGRYGIPNVGIFLWRVAAVQLVRTPLVGDGDGRRFQIDATGADAPLFAQPQSEDTIEHLATWYDVPLPLTRRWLAGHLDRYYGSSPASSMLLEVGTQDGAGAWDFVPVAVDTIRVCDLSEAPGGGGGWAHEPQPGTVALDPVLGRVWFGTAPDADAVPVATYFYGSAVPAGARGSARNPDLTAEPTTTVSGGGAIQALLNGISGGGTLRIDDSDRYTAAPPTVKAAPGAAPVHVTALDRARPVIWAPSGMRLSMAPGTTVVLDGLMVLGGPVILEEAPDDQRGTRELVLRNCTLVPGQQRTTDGEPVDPDRASLLVLDPLAVVTVESCVTGPIVSVADTMTITGSVVDASDPAAVAYCGRPEPLGGGTRGVPDAAAQVVGEGTTPGGTLDLHECTVVGGIHAEELSASNCLLVADLPAGDPRLAAVWARRRQEGCLRFSYLPPGSRTGRRFHCQPDPDAPDGTGIRPAFTSLRFGDPAYAQLTIATTTAIRHGADDESEMGVTQPLHIPQREDDLRVRLDEYLRFGLEAGVFYAT